MDNWISRPTNSKERAQNQKKALEAKKKRRGGGGSSKTSTNANKKSKQSKKKNDEDFIVSDEDYEMDKSSESSSSSEDERRGTASSSKKSPYFASSKSSTAKVTASSSDDDDDDDEMEGGFMKHFGKKLPKRSSMPAPDVGKGIQRRKKEALMKRKLAALGRTVAAGKASLSSSDDSSEEETVVIKRGSASVLEKRPSKIVKRGRKPVKKVKKRPQTVDLIDSDEEEEQATTPSTVAETIEVPSDSSSDDEGVTGKQSKSTTDSFRTAAVATPTKARKVLSDSPSADEFDADLELADTPVQPERKKPQRKKRKATEDNEDMTEEEKYNLDLAKAMSQSEHEFTVASSPEKKKEAPNSDEQEKEVVEVESDNQGDDDDESVDEEQVEAETVLNEANRLSKEVLQTMMSWSTTAGRDSSESAAKGLIVNGALSMFELSASKSANEERTKPSNFISDEDMRLICPKIKLAPYQLIGVNWMALLHGLEARLGGSSGTTKVNGVLADGMGLGKTIQTIAFLAWLRQQRLMKEKSEPGNGYVAPHLIVVPSSVLSNWEREFDNVCPDMIVRRYHGTQAEREQLREELYDYLPDRKSPAGHVDAILTTFSYFSTERTDDRKFLKKFDLDYVVIDEAHCLKNPRGARYRNLNRVKSQHRLLLTGTPVQNSAEELMALLCFLMPLFSAKSTTAWGESDGTREDGGESMLRHFVSIKGGDVDEAQAYKKLKQLFAPFVLRRQKQDVMAQTMPPKTRRVEYVHFDEAAKSVYDSILSDHVERQKGLVKVTSSTQKNLFTALRKAANHPLLLRTRHKSKADIDHMSKLFYAYGMFGTDKSCTDRLVRAEVEKWSDFDLHIAASDVIESNKHRRQDVGRYVLDDETIYSSPKFALLRRLLPSLISEGHRILIFSQWTRCLDLLGCLMESLGLECCRLDGQTPINERQELIDAFNAENSTIPVFLLSTRAGGLGINLTSADTCILHDLDFNPFNDLQAEDRCHRIGQTKPVTVIKLVTADTVDGEIYKMQERKAKMNAAILENQTLDKKEEASEVRNMLTDALKNFMGPGGK